MITVLCAAVILFILIYKPLLIVWLIVGLIILFSTAVMGLNAPQWETMAKFPFVGFKRTLYKLCRYIEYDFAPHGDNAFFYCFFTGLLFIWPITAMVLITHALSCRFLYRHLARQVKKNSKMNLTAV